MKNKSYFFVDYGNTNIKAGIYDLKSKSVVETNFIRNTKPILSLIKQFKKLNTYKVERVFVSATVGAKKSNNVIKQLYKFFNVDTKLITINDFKNFKNISKGIGTDLLLLGLYGSKIHPKALIVCLGTVYTAIVMNGNKYESVLLMPNIKHGINDIPNKSSIPSSLIPKLYDKNIGLNTKDCFSAGANLLIEGLVDNLIKKHNIKPSNVFITGGDCDKYKNINKKYKVIDNLTLKAISLLVK